MVGSFCACAFAANELNATLLSATAVRSLYLLIIGISPKCQIAQCLRISAWGQASCRGETKHGFSAE
jgi:hypothetical protein